MTADPELIKLLREDEGVVPHAYKDSLGFWTIGVGRLIDERKGGRLSDDEIDYLLANDIDRFTRQLDTNLPWWRGLTPARQRVMQSLAFNLGIAGLLGFHNTLQAIERGDYEAAATGMLSSRWAKQVKGRADRLAEMMRTG